MTANPGLELSPPDDETPRLLYFLHIPKTAGTTLTSILHNCFAQSEIFPPRPVNMSVILRMPNLLPEINHARFVSGHFDYAVTQLFTRPFDMITMLRNPAERTLSQLSHAQRRPEVMYWDEQKLFTSAVPLAELLQTSEARAFLGNIQTQSFVSEWVGIGHLPLWDIAPPVAPASLLLELAKQRLSQCRFVGIQERFDDSLRLLCFTLGFRAPRRVQNLQVGSTRLQLDRLTPDEQQQLDKLNELDDALYEYGLSLFEAQFQAMIAYLATHYADAGSLDEQLEAHYWHIQGQKQRMAVSATADQDQPQQWHYAFGQPLYGSNWQLREPFQDDYCRWTGPATQSILEWGIEPERDVTIEINCTGAITLEVLDSFQVAINEHPIELARSPGPNGILFTGAIPASAFQENVQVFSFSVADTFRPCDVIPGNPDERYLGINLSSITMTAAVSPTGTSTAQADAPLCNGAATL